MLSKANESNLEGRIRTIQKSEKGNRKCANCGESGPVYICMDYHTFVCTECSGLHRELGNKVKSISMSNWTKEEVDAIEFSGGNIRDRELFLATFDGKVFPRPTSQDRDRLRQFIRLKYIDRRWVADSAASATSPPLERLKTPEKKKTKKISFVNDWDDTGLINSPPKPPALPAPSLSPDDISTIDSLFSDGLARLQSLNMTDPTKTREIAEGVVSRIQECILNLNPSMIPPTSSSNPFDDPQPFTRLTLPILSSASSMSAPAGGNSDVFGSAVVTTKPQIISSNPFDSFP